MNLLPFAFSFAEQTCYAPGCGQSIQWVDAIAIVGDDGKLYGFRHIDCESP